MRHQNTDCILTYLLGETPLPNCITGMETVGVTKKQQAPHKCFRRKDVLSSTYCWQKMSTLNIQTNMRI